MAAKKYTKSIGKKAENYLAKGMSQRALCGHLNISRDTHDKWKKKYPEYASHIEKGQYLCEQFYLTKGIGLIEGEKGSAQTLFFFMKNILRYRDNIEGDQEKQHININFNKIPE